MKKVTLSLLLICLASIVHAQNVGVGTVAPPALRLHVSSPADSNLLLLENRSPLATTSKSSLYFKMGDYYTGAIKAIGTGTNEARLGIYTFGTPNINGLGERISILDGGNVGIGTTTPSADLDVNGTFRLRGGIPAAGRVLTSDASGNATWQTPAGANIGFRGELGNDLPVTSAVTPYKVAAFTEIFDDGGAFNGANGTFTAPSAGVYSFTATINWNSPPAGSGTLAYILRFRLNTTNIIDQTNTIVPFLANYGVGTRLTSVVKLNAGDVVNVEIDFSTSSTLNISGNGATASSFSGVKLY